MKFDNPYAHEKPRLTQEGARLLLDYIKGGRHGSWAEFDNHDFPMTVLDNASYEAANIRQRVNANLPSMYARLLGNLAEVKPNDAQYGGAEIKISIHLGRLEALAEGHAYEEPAARAARGAKAAPHRGERQKEPVIRAHSLTVEEASQLLESEHAVRCNNRFEEFGTVYSFGSGTPGKLLPEKYRTAFLRFQVGHLRELLGSYWKEKLNELLDDPPHRGKNATLARETHDDANVVFVHYPELDIMVRRAATESAIEGRAQGQSVREVLEEIGRMNARRRTEGNER